MHMILDTTVEYDLNLDNRLLNKFEFGYSNIQFNLSIYTLQGGVLLGLFTFLSETNGAFNLLLALWLFPF